MLKSPEAMHLLSSPPGRLAPLSVYAVHCYVQCTSHTFSVSGTVCVCVCVCSIQHYVYMHCHVIVSSGALPS